MTMAKQWLRACRMVIQTEVGSEEAIDFTQFRVVFRVAQGTTDTPKSLSARIYNVSSSTRAKFIGEGQHITLIAGYEENAGVIFRGQVRQLIHGRESQTDTFLEVLAATGDWWYRYGVINQSIAAGSTADERVDMILSASSEPSIARGFTSGLPKNTLPRGKAMFGMCRSYLKEIADTHQMSTCINDENQYEMVADGQPKDKEDQAFVITRETGLIGMPMLTIGGIYLDCALNPDLRWNRLIKLDNRSIQRQPYNLAYGADAQNVFISDQALSPDGLYIVVSLDHYGDTRGQEWASSLVCVGLNATVRAVTGASINSVEN